MHLLKCVSIHSIHRSAGHLIDPYITQHNLPIAQIHQMHVTVIILSCIYQVKNPDKIVDILIRKHNPSWSRELCVRPRHQKPMRSCFLAIRANQWYPWSPVTQVYPNRITPYDLPESHTRLQLKGLCKIWVTAACYNIIPLIIQWNLYKTNEYYLNIILKCLDNFLVTNNKTIYKKKYHWLVLCGL